MNRQELTDHITEIARRAAQREGLEVWEVEVLGGGSNRIVRIYIDKPAGVTLADCELMSEQVGAVLDVEDVVPGGSYNLEVSSPGVERKLRNLDDFRRFATQKAKLVLREPLEGQRRWDGVIGGVEGDSVMLETPNGKSIQVRMEQIEKANLKFEW